jgi:putative nucleotidyltransferase with HDIG domain
MSKFFDDIKNKIVDFFLEDDDSSKEDNSVLNSKNVDDTDIFNKEELIESDTTSLDVMKDRSKPLKSKAKGDIVDEDYWWCFEGHPPVDEVQELEGVDDDKVYLELSRRIDNDEFPVIEIPDNIMKTLQILNNPEFDYAEVSNLINHSPSMAGEFIKVINSSLYSRGVVINDLKLALPRLGKDNVKALLYMYSSKMSFDKDSLFHEVAKDIVEHSYAVAIIATYLSQRFYPDPDGAFLAGLLHDIGKLGILKAISETCPLPKKVDFKVTLEVLDNILPRLHGKAGRFLAENWKINKVVVSAIEHHHDFVDIGFNEDEQLSYHLSALVNLSDTMARILGYGQRMDAVNIFSLASTIDLSIARDYETIQFLDNIPEIVAFKSTED